jgi:hypothetical protein
MSSLRSQRILMGVLSIRSCLNILNFPVEILLSLTYDLGSTDQNEWLPSSRDVGGWT